MSPGPYDQQIAEALHEIVGELREMKQYLQAIANQIQALKPSP